MKFDQSVQEAAVEILGRSEVAHIFDQAKSSGRSGQPELQGFGLISEMSNEFSLKYHRNTARGLFLRIGDAAFPKLRRSISELNALGATENRLQPLEKRFESSLQVLVETLSALLNVPLSLESRGDQCFGILVLAPQQSLSADLLLYFLAGLLRSFGTWLDSRREYRVQVELDADKNAPAAVSLCILPAA